MASYDATDAKGLRRAFEKAVDDYLKICQLQNIKPEVPFKGSLNVRLGSDLHRRVAIAAAQHHSSVNKFIADTLNTVIN